MNCRWIKFARGIDICSCIVRSVWIIITMDLCLNSVPIAGQRSSRPAAPTFLSKITNVTVHKGEYAELDCHIMNLGPRMVVWRKASEENPLTIGERTFTPEKEISVSHERISKLESKWNLLIKNVQLRHAGVYECAISARVIHTHYVALNVLNTPVKIEPEVRISGTAYINQYEDIHLMCNATGEVRAPELVEWFFNGNKIETSHRHWYGRTELLNHRPIPGRTYISELIIHQSTTADQGNYVCRSSDLKINSLIVHILNSDRDSDKKPRAPGEESGLMREAETGTNTASSSGQMCHLMLQLVAILAILMNVA